MWLYLLSCPPSPLWIREPDESSSMPTSTCTRSEFGRNLFSPGLMSLYLARCTTLSLNEIDASHYRIKWHWPYLLCNRIAWRCVVAGLEVHPVAHHLCTFSNNISICVFVSSFWHIHPSEASCIFSFFPCLSFCVLWTYLYSWLLAGG